MGKTCLLMRFSENRFSPDHMPTIGIDFKIKMMVVKERRVKLQLWDTAGQERFQTITANYYRGSEGVLIVYDSTNAQTFTNVQNWLSQINENAEQGVLKILIANKMDAPNQEVTAEQGQALAREHKMEFFQTSAKTGENVDVMFDEIAQKVISL